MRRRILLLGVLATVVWTAACGSGATVDQAGGGSTTAPAGLAGRRFLSQTVTVAGAPRALVGTEPIILEFQGDHTLRAYPGCNILGVDYELDGDRLIASEVSSTAMACTGPEPAGARSGAMDQDDWFKGLLTTDAQMALDGDHLTLTSGDTVILFLDREVADPDRPLVGTAWTLEAIIDGVGASSVPNGVTATLSLPTDAQIRWGACNGSTGTAAIDTGAITVTDVVSTLKGCPPDSANVDATMAAVLTGRVSYEIEGPVLHLRKGDRGLDFRAPAA